jgi:hypothetical protein
MQVLLATAVETVEASQDIDWFDLIVGLFGGLALFLLRCEWLQVTGYGTSSTSSPRTASRGC